MIGRYHMDALLLAGLLFLNLHMRKAPHIIVIQQFTERNQEFFESHPQYSNLALIGAGGTTPVVDVEVDEIDVEEEVDVEVEILPPVVEDEAVVLLSSLVVEPSPVVEDCLLINANSASYCCCCC
jgi:hypothetical protein